MHAQADSDSIPTTRGLVLIVDDEPAIADVVSRYLLRAGYSTKVAADGTMAMDVAASLRPDLVVLDLRLPDVNGLEVMRRLRAGDQRRPAIIMLTGKAAESDRVLGLRLGADAYVIKPFSAHELVARVDAVMRRVRGEPASMPPLVTGDLEIDPGSRRVFVRGEEVHLTQREFDVLLHLASHPGRVFTRDDLMRDIWGYSFYTDTSTVTVHVRRLRSKIERDPASPAHLQTVWGMGYRFEP